MHGLLLLGTGSVVVEWDIVAVEETEVVVGFAVESADLADDTDALLAPVGLWVGTGSIGVLGAGALTAAVALVEVVLSVGATDGHAEVTALSAGVGGVGGIGTDSEPFQLDSVALEGAEVEVGDIVLATDWGGNERAIIACLHESGAFPVAILGHLDTISGTVVVVGPSVDPADRLVSSLALAGRGAGPETHGDLVATVEHALVLKGGPRNRADQGSFPVTVTCQKWVGVDIVLIVAGTVVCLTHLLGVQSALVAVGHGVHSADRLILLGTVHHQLSLRGQHLSAFARVSKPHCHYLQRANIWVCDVIHSANRGIPVRTEVYLA